MKDRPAVIAGALAFAVVIEWEVPGFSPLFSVGGSNVFPIDVISGLALLVAWRDRARIAAHIGSARFAWYGVGVLLVIGLFRGFQQFGLSPALNEFRGFLYPMAIITWAMSLDWSRGAVRTLVDRLSLLQGWLLVGVAILHIGLYGFGTADEEVEIGSGFSQTLRPLVSAQALVLLFCAFVVLVTARRGQPWFRITSGVVFLAVVLIVQQRSVWAAGLAALGVALLVGGSGARRALIRAAGVSLVVLAFALPALTDSVVVGDLAASSQSTGTLDGRTTSWGALIDQSVAKGPGTVLFGLPSGFGWGRFEGVGRYVEFVPHNWYVTVYLRGGIIALALMVLFVLIVLVRLWPTRRTASLLGILIVVATATYGWSYSWLLETAVLLGWSAAGAPFPPAAPAEPSPPPRRSTLARRA